MSEHRSIKGRARVLQSFFDHSGDSFAVKGTQCVYIRERNWDGILEGFRMIGNECFVDV